MFIQVFSLIVLTITLVSFIVDIVALAIWRHRNGHDLQRKDGDRLHHQTRDDLDGCMA